MLRNGPFLIIGLLVFAYIFAKAYLSSFTHDESFTYLNYCHSSAVDILSFSQWYTNNHVLNSFFMKYSEQLFGNSELALRLPNLILFIVYMTNGYILLKPLSFKYSVAIFLLLCTNPLLTDLFGLARGYGMSCGFMLMSIYCLLQHLKTGKYTMLAGFHISAILATLSSFVLFTFYVSSLLVIAIMGIYYDKITLNNWRLLVCKIKHHFVYLIIATAILYEPLRRLLIRSKLDFGGKQGFFEDTLMQLSSIALHYAPIQSFGNKLFAILLVLIVLGSLYIILRRVRLKDTIFFEQQKEFVFLSLVLIMIASIIILQHQIFGNDYPIGRFSIFLFPLMIFHFGFLVNCILSDRIHLRFRGVALICLCLASTYSFIKKASITSCAEWAYDSNTNDALLTVELDYESDSSFRKNGSLGVDWLFEPTANFYRITHEMEWLEPISRNAELQGREYLYLFQGGVDELNLSNYRVLKEYPSTKTILMKRSN